MGDGEDDDDQPPQGERQRQRSRSRKQESPRSSSDASQQQQHVVPAGIQQNQTTQNDDENSANVDPQNRVSNHSGPPQGQEDTRRQGPQTSKGKKNTAEKLPSTPQKAKKYKLMDSDEDDEEPQNEPGTSSESQTTVYYFFNKDEQQIRKDQL